MTSTQNEFEKSSMYTWIKSFPLQFLLSGIGVSFLIAMTFSTISRAHEIGIDHTHSIPQVIPLAQAETSVPVEDSHQGQGLPQFNTRYFPMQVFWLVLTFGFLYFLISRKSLPRVAEVIDQRENRIVYDLDKAEELNNQAQTLAAQTEDILSQAREQAQVILQGVNEKIEHQRRIGIAQLQKDIDLHFSQAELRIQESTQKALSEMTQTATSLTLMLTEKLLDETVDPQEALQIVTTILQDEQANKNYPSL